MQGVEQGSIVQVACSSCNLSAVAEIWNLSWGSVLFQGLSSLIFQINVTELRNCATGAQ